MKCNTCHHSKGRAIKKILTLIVCLSCSAYSMQAYVYGYTRLYNADTKMTVDLLYDFHIPNSLTPYAMETLPLNEVREYLYPTERYVLEALERLNTSNEAQDIALVWETCKGFACPETRFLGSAECLIANRLENLTFIDADQARPRLELACLGKAENISLFKSILFTTPLCFSSEQRKQIEKRSGVLVWNRLQKLLTKTVKHFKSFGIKEFLTIIRHERKDFSKKYWKHFLAFSALVEIELLFHILSSSKKRIIVYCGGAHARNLKAFLTDSASWSVLCDYGGYASGSPKELSCDVLKQLMYPL